MDESDMLEAEDQVHKALAIAAQDGQHQIIEILLDYGADIDYKFPCSWWELLPIHVARRDKMFSQCIRECNRTSST